MQIGIIGHGFSGLMVAYHLVNQSNSDLTLFIFEKENRPGSGIAYSPQSEKVLLNVIASKMSAFPDKPTDFVDWLLNHPNYKNDHPELVANSFIPRSIYGQYLTHIWNETQQLAGNKNISIHYLHEEVLDLNLTESSVEIFTSKKSFLLDKIIISTGNQLPRNPSIKNEPEVIKSGRYFQNPWNYTIDKIDSDKPIFIVGNGLTMVDTVIQIREKKLSNKIISLSPHGFNILPHRQFTLNAADLFKLIELNLPFNKIISQINQHLKSLHKHGISAEPLIDFLRPNTQSIWRNMSLNEKKIFLKKLRHLWGVARHRLPFVTYDIIQKEQINKNLEIISGKIQSVELEYDCIKIHYWDIKNKTKNHIKACILINCTGPESEIERTNSTFLKNAIQKEIICQDELKLGIKTDITTFQTLNKKNIPNYRILTLGSTLRGELWESTAINELRIQAKNLALNIN